MKEQLSLLKEEDDPKGVLMANKKKQFSRMEKRVLNAFRVGEKVTYEGSEYTVKIADKPTCKDGEPKTDIYILLEDDSQNKKEIKISFKMDNADFIENKITRERAGDIFGKEWQDIIKKEINTLKEKFENRPLVYFKEHGKVKAGSFTIGWRFELANKKQGELSTKLELTPQKVLNIYAGTGLEKTKKNALVNVHETETNKIEEKEIENSGVANFMLRGNVKDDVTTENIFNKLVDIKVFCAGNPNVYAAFKALNYRSLEQKVESLTRELAVWVDWKIINNKLCANLQFDRPLEKTGKPIKEDLEELLEQLSLRDDILKILSKIKVKTHV